MHDTHVIFWIVKALKKREGSPIQLPHMPHISPK